MKTIPEQVAETLDPKPIDEVGMIMDYESGQLDDDGIIKLFQHLIDTGKAWSLQGSYGRTAQALIDNGYCTRE